METSGKFFSVFIFMVLFVHLVYAQEPEPRRLDVPYVPTHEWIVEEMLKMAEVTEDDVLYDLGSGDGRIFISLKCLFQL